MNYQKIDRYKGSHDGAEMRDNIEILVAARDIEKLRKVEELTLGFIAKGEVDAVVSYIDINEFVGYAIEQIEKNVDSSIILKSPLRDNMYN